MLICKFDSTNIETEIEAYENKHSFRFPQQYRDFLLEYNGGRTPKTKFKVNKVESDIRAFYGLGRADEHYNYSTFNGYVIDNFLEDSMVPIAENSFGDYILIKISDEDEGKIYFCVHDMPKKYILLSDDFKIFASKCKSERIGQIATIEERKERLRSNGNEHLIPKFMNGWQKEIDLYANLHQEELVI